jgi:tetratricopeptide (TPR) repeat protein
VNMTLGNLGELLRELGRLTEAETYVRESLKGYEALGLAEKVAIQRLNLGDLALEQARPTEAAQQYRAALTTFKHLNLPYWESRTIEGLGRIALDAAELDHAEEHFQNARHIAQSIQAIPPELNALAGLALIAERRGQHAQAIEWFTTVAQHPACEAPTRERAQAALERLKHT